MALYPIKGIRVGGDVHPIDYDALHGKKCVEFTEQTLTEEQKAQARTNIDVPSLDTLTSVETQLNGSISANKKQIENLKKLAQGKIYDFETDTTEAYVKDVPMGAAPYTAMKSIGGKSIVMNQLLSIYSNNSNENWGITYTFSKANQTCTFNGTSTSNSIICSIEVKNTKDHKYFIRSFKVSGSVTGGDIVASNQSYHESECGGGVVVTSSSKNSTWYYAFCCTAIGTVCDNLTLKMNVIDLTLAGLEDKTVEELNAMFPDYIPYNEGEIVSAEVQKVRSLGVNLFDIERFKEFSLENGGTVTDTTATLIPSKVQDKLLFSGFKPNTSYAFMLSGQNAVQVLKPNIVVKFIDGKMAYPEFGVAFISSNKSTIVGVFGCWQSGTSTFNLQDCYIMPVEEGKDVEYKPYKSDTFVIPKAIKSLEGYGWSAGSVCNEVDFERKKFIKRVGSVDLGSLSWITESTATSGVIRLKAIIANCMPCNPGAIANIICEKYETATANDTYSLKKDKIISVHTVTSGEILYVYDSSYNTIESLSAFADSVQGVMLYYELAEPEEIDISDILTDDNLIEVEQGGTLTFENIHGDSYRLPVPSDVEYMINLQEATA